MHRFWLTSLVFAFYFLSASAQSFQLYGVIGDTLVTVNSQTGDASTVGYVGPGFGRIGDLIYHPPTDLLYGVANPTTDPELVSLDRNTGLATAIGMIDMVSPNLDFRLVEGMGYDDVTGQVYVAGYESGPASNWYFSRRFGTLDLTNGNFLQTATVSGTCQNDFDGMAFWNGVLYGVDGCPNPVNFCSGVGVSANVAFVGNTGTQGIADLAVEPNTGVIYAPVNQSRELVTIDPTSGLATLVGTTHSATEYNGAVMISLAFAPDPPDTVDLDLTVVDVSCFGGSDGTITAIGSSPNPPVSFSLNGGPFSPGGMFTGLAAGTYTVVAQDAAGNDSSATVVVAEPPLLQATATASMGACANANQGAVLLQAIGGTPAYSYSLDGSTFFPAASFSNLGPGPYTATVQDQNGCLATASFVVVEPPALQLSFVATPASCDGIGDGAVLFVSAGGTPGYTYSLDGVNYGSQPQLNGLQAGQYVGYLRDQNGCELSANFVIGALAGVVLVLDSLDMAVCPGDPTTAFLSGAAGNSPFAFSLNNNSPQAVGQFAGLSPGLATFSVVDQQGCRDELVLPIPEPPALDPGFSHGEAACTFPTQVNFVPNQTNWVSLDWDFGNGTSADSLNVVGSYGAPGSYTVALTAENADGCQASSQLQIELLPLPIAEFSSAPEMPGQVVTGDPVAFTNQSQFATQWNWDFGDGGQAEEASPVHVYDALGEYCTTLIALNGDGCRDTSRQCALEVVGDGMFVPSAFSPNGDGLNDQFEIVAAYVPGQFHLLVFNRWGQLVFESQSLADFWDASFRGQAVPEGVYTWRIDFSDPYGRERRRQGTVTVIR